MSNKRSISPSVSPQETNVVGEGEGQVKRAKTTASSVSDTSSTSTANQISLHSWLHPTSPAPIISHSPALHSGSSTFLSFSLTFEAPTHVRTQVSLDKEIKRIVRELDVVSLVGKDLLLAREGAFQDGEGVVRAGIGGKGKERAREPDHRMWGVRTIGLKEGKDGTKGEDDYQLLESFNDDGEKFGGERVLRSLRESDNGGAVDVLTICCRWYGGDMIGPIRFQHIATTSHTSLKNLLRQTSLRDARISLEGLDEEISSLRAALLDISTVFPSSSSSAAAEDSSTIPTPTPTPTKTSVTKENENGRYDQIDDLTKLQRLITAKQKTRDSLQTKLGSAI